MAAAPMTTMARAITIWATPLMSSTQKRQPPVATGATSTVSGATWASVVSRGRTLTRAAPTGFGSFEEIHAHGAGGQLGNDARMDPVGPSGDETMAYFLRDRGRQRLQAGGIPPLQPAS